ncbi:MAG: myo-inositol-1(or 4)-monophosphatase [Myxococcota bacterium]|jgi:myo-inositol-1(or 4)-monophosphatase
MTVSNQSSESASQERLTLAIRLAKEAGAIQRERYESKLDIQTKSAPIDLVTEVDRQCEALIIAGIESEVPGDDILAEEGGARKVDGAVWRWVIDPLDGTVNFAHGFPRFCVSIGIEHQGKRHIGVVYDPLLDECYTAIRGQGAFLGERRLEVSQAKALDSSLVATGFAYDIHKSDVDNIENFGRMIKAVRGLRRDGSAALDLCYVAAGRLDAYWEFKLHPWDVAAGLLIVEEAGGRVSDASGGPAPASGVEVVASNGTIHDELLAQLST